MRTQGPHVAAFLERFVRHTKGRWADRPLSLEPFQREFIDELFELDRNGRRVYNFGLLGEPRKNGKSTLSAGVALYMLCADGEFGPEVYSVAGAKDQARVVFEQARQMAQASELVPDFLRVQRNDIAAPDVNGVFRVLSADAPLQHGLNPSATVCDELHAHPSLDLLTALTTATGARDQPLTLVLTTAGHDLDSPLGGIYSGALKLDDVDRRGYLTVCRDRANGFLLYWYGAPDDADIDDPAVWSGCNPASWITEDYLRAQRHSTQIRLNDFRRLHLNQWTEIEEAWIDPGEWDACRGELQIEAGARVWIGVDIGQVRDRSAVVVATWVEDRLHVRARVWEPQPGRPIEIGEVEHHITQLAEQFSVAEVAFDPMRFGRSAELLRDRGVLCVQVDPSNARMARVSSGLYDLIRERLIVHDGDPVLRSHVLAGVAAEVEGGWRISKRRSKKPIDALVALALAAHRAVDGRRGWTGPLIEVFGG